MLRPAKKIFIFSFLAAGLFLSADFALAAVDVGSGFVAGTGLSNIDPRIIAARVVQIFLGFLGVVALGLIMYGGYTWMTSSGDESKVQKAKDVLRNAIIGLVIILSAFGIVTFILSKILVATGPILDSMPGGSRGIGGSGVLGSCSVESVYPAPDQKDVPRNTFIMVTFKEEVDPKTVCASVNATTGCCDDSNILIDGSIAIYKSGDEESTFLTKVKVHDTPDHKTFVFVPEENLGSPSEYLWYTVHLGSKVSKPDGRSIFESCQVDLEWQFEVSNKIDLTPPQVKYKGVFPPPDNGRDSVSITSSSSQAVGSIKVNSQKVNSQPKVYAAARVTSVNSGPSSPSLSVGDISIDPDCSEGGSLTLTVATDGSTTQLSSGSRLLGSAVFNGKSLSYPGLFSLSLPETGPNPTPGNSWTIVVSPTVKADTLTVGRLVYVFVSSPSAPNHIGLGDGVNETAANIAAAIDGHPDVSALAVADRVDIKAVLAGSSGNNIALSTSNPAVFGLSGSSLSGGSDRNEQILVSDRRDQPMNTVVQINFNEAVLPTTVVGTSDQVASYIRVVNAAGGAAGGAACSLPSDCRSYKCESNVCVGNVLPGKFKISNQYRTVEFISDNQCGVNGCGDPIYCLPANSQLRVEMTAASLTPCSVDDNCAAKSPYNSCSTQPQSGSLRVCRQDFGGNYPGSKTRNHPAADISAMNGVMDAASNSLDGDRNGEAEGPVANYSDNTPVYSSDSRCQADFNKIIQAVKVKRIEQNKVLGDITGSFCSNCSCSTPAACQTRMDAAMQSLGLPGAIKDYGGAYFIFDENEDEGTYGACRSDSVSSLNCGGVSIPFYFCAEGDNFSWTFFINDRMEVTPPVLQAVVPSRAASISLGGEISGEFNKMMMSSSLSTGQTAVFNGQETVIHKNLNVWSLAGKAVGYWIESEGVDVDGDGEMDRTKAYISHNLFDDAVSYRAQMGSGIKDIYQNCFKPSDDGACGVSETAPSCCNGVSASDLDQSGNCR